MMKMRSPLGACVAALALEAAAAAEAPEITLREDSAGVWTAEYRLAAPARRIVFLRNPNDWRVREWTPTDPDFAIVHIEGESAIVRKDGRAFASVAARLPARYVGLPKDYAPFSPFSDGGVLIYTGQFHACPEAATCGDVWRMRIEPIGGSRIIADGSSRPAPAEIESRNSGANIYAGSGEAIETPHVVALIDPGLPEAVSALLSELLPRYMDYFAAAFGGLSAKPALFVSLDPAPPAGTGLSSQGGTLPGQIFMHFYGEGWRDAPASSFEGFLPWFFAHEAAHLYQSEGIEAPFAMAASWIHEGGADALAARALTEIGGANADYVTKRVKASLDQCANELRLLEQPLNAAGEAGRFDAYYACGLLIHLAIDADVRRASGGARSLLDVWKAYIAKLRGGEAGGQGSFLVSARAAGATVSANFAVDLASLRQEDPAAFLRSGLAASGYALAD